MTRAACADAVPCGPMLPSRGAGGAAKPSQDSKQQEKQQQQQEGSKTLSGEARGFLKDDLNAALQQRNKAITDAAWQSLE